MTAGEGAARARAEALVERIRGEIPLTAAMDLRVAAFDGEALTLALPLAPNVNDKGTAFAGSITALGCIAGWCLLTLWSEAEIDGPCQAAIYESRFSFRKPLRGAFSATVRLPAAETCAALREALLRKGKGRLALRITLADADGEAVVVEADYALWRA